MDHTTIEEQHIAERYVMGRLPAEEVARFEEHYLTCEECLDRLQLAERFHLALRGLAAEDSARATGVGILAALARLAQWQRTLLAAGLLFAIALPTAQWVRLAREQQQLSGPQAISTLLPLSPVRSSSSREEPVAQLTLTKGSERVAFSLDAIGAVDRGPLHIVLADPSGVTLWRSPPTLPDAAGQLLISLPSNLLKAGDHELRLELPDHGTSLGGPYRFRVIYGTK